GRTFCARGERHLLAGRPDNRAGSPRRVGHRADARRRRRALVRRGRAAGRSEGAPRSRHARAAGLRTRRPPRPRQRDRAAAFERGAASAARGVRAAQRCRDVRRGGRGVHQQAAKRLPLIRAAVSARAGELEQLRARFIELAPEGFEEEERGAKVELAAYGEAALRVLAAFPDARTSEVESGWEERWRAFHRPVRIGPLWVGPPWEQAPSDSVAVVIDPGRAFGTGAH